jgi:DNA-binding response OmpR family regulator
MQRAIHPSTLIVEDDTRLRSVLAASLRGYGYHVHTAGTAAAADAILRDETITAIIVDLELPDESGWEIIRRIRSMGSSGPRTIVISAANRLSPPDSETTPDAVLSKPFAIEALIHHLLNSDAPRINDAGAGEGV